LEEKTKYTVEITPEAEAFYYNILEYFYKYHSAKSADKKSNELLELAISLEANPTRGTFEKRLKSLGKEHRFLLYYYTTRNAIKVIYFVDELNKVVYVTDFFPCENDDKKISKRNTPAPEGI
jgi:mRNA-degrading endonuclease RelE of RelBE toxin-antitoxin system